MGKALVISEKPSVARDIAAALGGFRDQDGYFASDAYYVSWAVGHLFELLEPEEIDDVYKRWTLDTLPILPSEFKRKPKAGHSDRIRTLRKLLERDDVDQVINACDAGREGELIFREIVDYFDCQKPIRRLWLQSMTPAAIRAGFAATRPGEELEGLAAAAACRANTDWLIGMNATRALTKRLRGRRERGAWSAGRVQTPTLALLVHRELEVLAHRPVPYWRLLAQFEHEGNGYAGTWFDPAFRAGEDPHARDDRIFDETRAREILAAVQGQPGVAGESRKPSQESAPPLFDLTGLQREGNRRLGWSARRTLSAAQRCYEAHKILTYPRTDSRCLPTDYRSTVDQALHAWAGAPGEIFAPYAQAANQLLRVGRQNEGRIFDDSKVSDHFAIIPTGQIPRAPLSGDDKRLFDLVLRRFLAAFYPPARWERVERTTEVAGHRFRSRSRTLMEPGWRAVTDTNTEQAEPALPALRPGQSQAAGVAVANREVELEADKTKPPPRLSEARLLSLMENAGRQVEDEEWADAMSERGLGTPATRADVIENLIAKGYALRQGKALRPTPKAVRLIDILKRIKIERLASPELTGEVEYHLNQVEAGRRPAADFMGDMEGYTREIIEHAKSFDYPDLYAEDPPLGVCPCERRRPVVESLWFYRCSEDPEAEEDCPLRIWKDTSGRYIDRGSVEVLLQEGKTPTLEGFTARDGRNYGGILEIDLEERSVRVQSQGWEAGSVNPFPEYEVDPSPLGPCPLEGECSVVESPTHYVCERSLKEEDLAEGEERPTRCGFTLPRTVCKREIVRSEAIHYLEHRRTGLLTDFTSRYGRPFSADLVLKPNGRHGFEFPPREAKSGTRKPARKTGGRKTGARKTTTRKTGTRKVAARKTAARKTSSRKTAARKTAARKTATRKAVARKTATRKTAARKTTTRKTSARKSSP